MILQSNHNLRNSIKDSSGLVSSDATALNVASNGRYDLWRTGLNIFQHNFIFGVGPRAIDMFIGISPLPQIFG